jgi:membrane peptidoglycan carboxypeptidase
MNLIQIYTLLNENVQNAVDPELRAEFEETKKANPFANMIQQAADTATNAAGGEGGAGGGGGGVGPAGFDLASWMAGAQKGRSTESEVGGGGGSVSKRKGKGS